MNNPSCPKCRSAKVYKVGKYPVAGKLKQRFKCFKCGKTFFKRGK